MDTSGRKPQAVLDTSFWATSFQVQLTGYLLRTHELVVPPAVEREILAPNAQQPRLLYPDQALFQQVRGLMTPAPTGVPPAVTTFGAGEREAISVAMHLGVRLLINDHRLAVYARNLQLTAWSVPDFVVRLRAHGLVTDAHARAMLDLCLRTTNAEVVANADRLLDELKEPD